MMEFCAQLERDALLQQEREQEEEQWERDYGDGEDEQSGEKVCTGLG